jgi:hypothetical protein
MQVTQENYRELWEQTRCGMGYYSLGIGRIFWEKVVFKLKMGSSAFVHHHGVCVRPSFLLCLLIRLSESSDSWPRNKTKIVPFPNGFI